MAIGRMAVVGAGQMGSGIAQVAAQAGLSVTLVDAAPELAEKALARLGAGLQKLVEKGKLTAEGFMAYRIDPNTGTISIPDATKTSAALQAMLHEGLISEEEFDKHYEEATKAEEGLAKLKELEAKAGSNAAVTAYLAGVPKGAAAFLGFVAGGYPGLLGGTAVGGPIGGAVGGVLTGTAGAYGAGKAYDWLYKELADPKIRESVEAAIKLHPYYNAAGEMTLPAATIPVR